MERITELIKKAENVKEERKEAVRTMFRKTRGKSGMRQYGEGKFDGENGKKEDLNEVEQLYQKLMECKLPEET